MRIVLPAFALAIVVACMPRTVTLTDAQKAAVADSAKAVVINIVDNVNKGDVSGVFAKYSTDPAARFAQSGVLYGSLDSMKLAFARSRAAADSAAISVDRYDAAVLGPDVVVITAPFHYTLKPQGKKVTEGTGVWSGVVYRSATGWELVQSNESLKP